jgi:drug/metabolite transporter (DMT)-like permease
MPYGGSSLKKGLLYILLSTVLFSTMEVVLKVIATQVNPIQITFLRFFIGSVVLMPPAIKELRIRNCHFKGNDCAFFALTGFAGVVVSMVLYQMAILYSQASTVAVLFSCNPVFVVLFAFLLLHEKIYRHTVISLIVSITGMIVIINPGYESGNAIGFALSIFAAVTFSIYSVISRKRSQRYGSIALTCFSFLFGCLELILLIFVSRITAVSAFFTNAGLKAFAAIPVLEGIHWSMLPSLIYIGIFVTGLGYTFYFLAMEATSAALASLVFFIKPALAPILALILIHDSITGRMWIGIILILAGSCISFLPGWRLSTK